MNIKMYIVCEINGVRKIFEVSSFVSNFMKLLRSTLASQWIDVIDVNGNLESCTVSERVCYGAWNNHGQWRATSGTNPGRLLLNAPEGDSSYGIVVGTGETPVSPNDYKLENQIPHGSADGQLYYYVTTVSDILIENDRVIQKLGRRFENKGSVDLTIKEIGLIAVVVNNAGSYSKVLIARDLLTEPVEIPSGSTAILEVWLVTEV